jgi:hypothetical protein
MLSHLPDHPEPTTGGEPPPRSPATGSSTRANRCPPYDAVSPPLANMWVRAVPRRTRWRAELGRPPARPRARTLGWAEIPPDTFKPENPFLFFLFPLFPFSFIYLCTY